MKTAKTLFLFCLTMVFCLGITTLGIAEIKIGVIMPMTGAIAHIGDACVQGIQIAVDEVNAQGGIKGEKVTFKLEDSKSDPKEAVTAVSKLIEVDKIKILYGPDRSSGALACKPIIAAANAVTILPVSTHPDIPGASQGVFRTCPGDEIAGVVAARLAKELNLRKTATLYENTDYGKGLSDSFVNKAKTLGISVPITEKFTPQDQEFRTQLTKIKATKVDGLWMVATSEVPNIANQANLLKLNAKILANESAFDPKFLERGGKDMEGMYFVSPAFYEESPDPATQKFIKAFKAKFPNQPVRMYAAEGYEAMAALLEAIKRKGTDPMEIRKGILSLKNFPGPLGPITILPNGDVEKPFGIFQVENSKFVFKKLLGVK